MKEPGTRGYILYNSIYRNFWKRRNYMDENQISGCRGFGMSGKD